MFGRAPTGPPLAWSWADQQLHTARNYWVVTADPTGRPHARPLWGYWTAPALLFSTASRTLANVRANPRASVHLESGSDVVIVEGRADVAVDSAELHAFVATYNRKYGASLAVHGQQVGDDKHGDGGVVVVHAEVVYAWQRSVETATKWRFPAPA